MAEELFTRGDPRFVAELRGVHDADRLGKFAAKWMADSRPFARQALIDYFSLPLNCYRHEALVKRLFKLIEKAGDDELMGVLLVAFDRSIRRRRQSVNRHKWDNVGTLEEAQAKLREWEAEGYQTPPWQNWQNTRGRLYIYATKPEEVVVAPRDAMPRPGKPKWLTARIPDTLIQRYEKRYKLFSLPTRRYLRRRAWRYFRKLDSIRYLNAAYSYLRRYSNTDVDSDIHLLDNWGLVHTLFGESPVLERKARGWEFAPGKSLDDLAAAPRFPQVWAETPFVLLHLLIVAPCRTVRQWAKLLLESGHRDWLSGLTMYFLLELIDHADPEVAALGYDLLEKRQDLSSVPVGDWLQRLEGDDLEKLQRLAALLERSLDPNRVSLADSVKLALHRSLPVANFGLTLLKGRSGTFEENVPALLPLVQAECEAVRPRLMEWLKSTLEKFGPPRSEWVLEFFDSKHQDVRTIGWVWLSTSSLRDEPSIWQRLLESPYDDMKTRLLAELELRAKGAERGLIQGLWASVLLNIHRGGRSKPGIVRQIVDRLVRHSKEANELLPLLAIAVRSLRGPEFRAGLAGVVSLHENNAELRPAIAKQFPELSV